MHSTDSNNIDDTVFTAKLATEKYGYTDGAANNVGRNDNSVSEIMLRCQPEELTYGNSIYHHESAYQRALVSKVSKGLAANTGLKIVPIGQGKISVHVVVKGVTSGSICERVVVSVLDEAWANVAAAVEVRILSHVQRTKMPGDEQVQCVQSEKTISKTLSGYCTIEMLETVDIAVPSSLDRLLYIIG